MSEYFCERRSAESIAERKHKLDPGFLAVQAVGEYDPSACKVVPAALIIVVTSDDTVEGTGHKHNINTLIQHFLQTCKRAWRYVALSESLKDQPVVACIYKRVEKGAINPCMCLDQSDFVTEINFIKLILLRYLVMILERALGKKADWTVVRALECGNIGGMCLRDIPCSMDFIIEDDQNTALSRSAVHGGAQAGDVIVQTVRTDFIE